ncbi:MAG TPA: hypothetical protein VIJ94_08250, partial [Caulobacteraceae bacterium]
MTGRKLIFAAIAAATFAACAGAHAETKSAAAVDNFTVHDSYASDANQWSPQVGRRSLQWDSKKAKWGLKLDM